MSESNFVSVGIQGPAGPPGKAGSTITAAPMATSLGELDTIGISTAGADHQITLQNLAQPLAIQMGLFSGSLPLLF